MPDNVLVVFQSAIEIGRFDIANEIMRGFLETATKPEDTKSPDAS